VTPHSSMPQRIRTGPLKTLACICLAGLVAGWYFVDFNRFSSPEPGEVTGSLSAAPGQVGPSSGLPMPRFVSLKANTVNVRKGPSSDHAVAWVFKRKGMPVEIIAEFENWRKIRDSEGAEGWILQQMLSGKRSAIVMSYGHAAGAVLRASADDRSQAEAVLEPGVVGFVSTCDGVWCEVEAQGYEGYVPQARLWGVYPGEVVD
jgi:SH3-like domain-containing protein